jgi:hypothetical protein
MIEVKDQDVTAVRIADFSEPTPGSYLAQLEEQARRKHVQPIESVDELPADVVESARNWTSSWLTFRPSVTSTWPDLWHGSSSTPTWPHSATRGDCPTP